MASGNKLALVTLAAELVLAVALVAENFGLFALMAMPFVGVAWLPAALMMFSDLRQDTDARPLSYIAAALCFAAGAVCLVVSANWVVMAMFV